MKVIFRGCRGSIPTPYPENMKYGGNTTCLEVRLDEGTALLFDAGTGIRKAGQNLLKEPSVTEVHLFLTHAHWDHLSGFPFFVPAYIPKYTIHVRGGMTAKRYLENILSQQMEAPFFPVKFDTMKAKFDFHSGRPKQRNIGAATVTPIPLSHPNGGFGFKIDENGKSVVFLTDNELEYQHKDRLPTSEYIDICKRADLLIHDSQYTDEEYENKKN
jgi:phosphoribosyl 1,2-cyclic phosphodiesterase